MRAVPFRVLPALALMRVGATVANGEDCIEHQDALACPRREIAVRWNRAPDIVVKLFVDVDERRGRGRRAHD